MSDVLVWHALGNVLVRRGVTVTPPPPNPTPGDPPPTTGGPDPVTPTVEATV